MEDLSPYELLRLKRVEENRRVLRELGLLGSDKPPVIRKTVHKPAVPKKRPSVATNGITSVTSNEPLKLRRSIRTRTRSRFSLLAGEDTESENDSISNLELSEDETTFTPSGRNKLQRPNLYGAIEGIPVGTTWQTRLQCATDGVHRPSVAGIHGGAEGAYSIALSGGYEDDIDFGEGFTYTGSGGRDLRGTVSKPKNLRTAPQSKDQILHGVNASLAASVESRHPIRVIRGYKLPSVYAPEEGYRYDGLYTAEKFWFATGLSGFKVVKYALKRLKDQDAPPWNEEQFNVLETQPRSTSPMEDMNIRKENHTRIKIDQTDLTNIEISSQSTDKSPKLICKLTDIKSESPSPRKVINTPKEKKTPCKLQELKQNSSSKSSLAFKVVNSVHKNGTNLYKNEISLQDKKTPWLEQNLITRNSSAKKVVNSHMENDTNPRENEVALHDEKTSKTPLKIPTNELESKFSSRNSLHENGFKPQEKKISSQDKKTSKTPLKTPKLERDNSSRRSSIKNIVISLHENGPNSQDSKINLPVGKPTKSFPQTPKPEQNLLLRSSSRKKIVNSPRENGSNVKDEQNRTKTYKIEQLDKKSKIPSKATELEQNHSLKRPKTVVNTYHKNEPNVQFISDLESKGNFLKLDEKLSLRNCQNPVARKVINTFQKNDDKQGYNPCSETSTKCRNKLDPMTNSLKIIPQKKVKINYKDFCEHCLKVPHLESENEDRDNIAENEYKPFLKLPGQTTILKYFKPPNASIDILRNNKNDVLSKEIYNFKTNEPKVENKDTESPKKKILNNKEVVVAKSLRGNRRPSLYMDNNFNFSPDSPECVTSENSPNKSVTMMKENGIKHILDEHDVENSSKTTSKTIEGDKLVFASKKRKSTSLIEFERQERVPTVQSLKNVQNVESPVSTLCKQKVDEVNNKCLHSPDVMRPDLSPEIRSCYVKLMKLSESDFSNFSGWDDDTDKYFTGFTDTDGKNAILKQTQFGNVFISLVHTCKKTVSPKYMRNKSPNTWPGWDMVPSRSIVVNGFLIDKYSNES